MVRPAGPGLPGTVAFRGEMKTKHFAALVAVMLTSPAFAQKNVTCTVIQVMHTRYGVLVHCAETITDRAPTEVDNVNWFAPDASLLPNANGIVPALSVADTMRGFEAIALESFRSKHPLNVTFVPGTRPGGLFDCLNSNCRLASAWTISQ